MNRYFLNGAWNAICDRCGFEFKSFDLRKEWTGLMVCKKCWEPRHPQDLIRVPKEEIAPPWTRPEPEDVFVNVGDPIYTEWADILFTESGEPILTET